MKSGGRAAHAGGACTPPVKQSKAPPLQARGGARSHVRTAAYFLELPILQMVVPHSGHLPLVMGRPFLVTTSMVSCISRFALHFMQ